MLSGYQVQYLAQISGLKVRWLDSETPIGIVLDGLRRADDVMRYPYDNFKVGMGIDHIRFHWLLGENNFLAGGCVLNWIWQEQKNDDVDFFFKNFSSADTFVAFLKSVGMVETKQTNYARTLFSRDSKAIIQAVGPREEATQGCPVQYGQPDETISSFDIDVCKFAVDIEYVYFTKQSIVDLIRMVIEVNPSMQAPYRIDKYIRKGFFPGESVHGIRR